MAPCLEGDVVDHSPGKDSNYRWLVLALATMTHTFGVAMPTMCMPVLFKEISDDLGLSLLQVGAVWGAASLTGLFTGLMAGTLGDRFGVRRTLSAACILAGVAGAARGLSNGFETLTISALLFGFLYPAIPSNVHKSCSLWFGAKRLGLANGFVSMGMALGFTGASMVSATFLSPWLGGWRNVLFFYGILSLLVGIPWRFVRQADVEKRQLALDRSSGKSMRGALVHVARQRNVWLLGLAMLGLGGCIQGALGYLPLYLRGQGWPAATADRALATFHLASMIFAIPIAVLSDRSGRRKWFLQGSALLIGGGVAMLAFTPLVWLAVLMAGFSRDGFMAIFMTTVIESDGIGPAYAGAAVGYVMIFSSIGSLLSPLAGNSLAGIAPGLPFFLWALMGVLALALFALIREGKRGGLELA
jgi:MFS family permease